MQSTQDAEPQVKKTLTYMFEYADGSRLSVNVTETATDIWALSRMAAQSAGITAETTAMSTDE